MSEKSTDIQGVDTRVAAARLLNQVIQQRATIDESLTMLARKMGLSDGDKRLVHAISGIVFRNLPAIDGILRHVMDRKRDPSPVMLHHLLRVGVAQLLWMDVAPHAAVHSTVSAAGSLHLGRQKSLVNAVLRSVQRQKDDLLAGVGSGLDMLPEWLSRAWSAQYGEDKAQSIALAALQEAPLDISIKDADASLQWAQMLRGEELVSGSVRVHQGGGHLTSWPGFTDGSWWVQDLSASFPIKLLAHALTASGDMHGMSVLDLCAAPGGKTLQLASLGAKVTALDIAASRMIRLTENVSRVRPRGEVETVVADAMSWRTDMRFDAVVLDAPCSSTGTLRRHPELPWIHEKNSVEKLGLVQRDLLRRSADLLVHDGILLYCTCSLEVEEGENQVAAFLDQYKDFKEITDIPAVVHPYLVRGQRNIGFRTFPDVLSGKGGMDGFFMALLKRL